MKFGTEDFHKKSLSSWEFCENWCTDSHTYGHNDLSSPSGPSWPRTNFTLRWFTFL